MSSPSTTITRFDLSIAYNEFDLLMNRMGFIGHLVMPPVGVSQQSAEFLRVKVESLLGPIENTERAPRGAYSRGSFEWDKDSYSTKDHGVEEVIDERTVKMYGDEIKSEQIHRDRAIHRMAQAYENEVASTVFNTSTWTGEKLTTTAIKGWNDRENADPIGDIDNACDRVRDGIGMDPIALIVPKQALRYMLRTERVENLLKHNGITSPEQIGQMTLGTLAELLRIDSILVAEGFKNVADKGQSKSFARLWNPTMAMVARIALPGDSDLESTSPCLGRTIMWTEENAGLPGAEDDTLPFIVEEYSEDFRRGSVIRVRADYQVKLLHKEAGHLITGVISSDE